MSQARFIVSDNKYLCNICSDPISKDKIISLKCNPDKHIFCYDCIKEWYCEISNKKKHKHHHENYTIITMCPICRCNGGLLPVYKNDIPIKGVNNMINIIPINILLTLFICISFSIIKSGISLSSKKILLNSSTRNVINADTSGQTGLPP